MAKKREIHFSSCEQHQIMRACGVLPSYAMNLQSIVDHMTFEQLDSLTAALKIIRKGEHVWRKP